MEHESIVARKNVKQKDKVIQNIFKYFVCSKEKIFKYLVCSK